ncbi:GntR family transcriptional regulator [Brevibacillus humidisoli]|uniref:GntR family transcriptional regulator n=1 Tax=Brevibacillus humidisoli TaxID=2895522 RepID=UPI001E4B9AD1|nr:GntR family transcriptional regulator [Brevibacillus humidisoli]UFJ41394.1 GntR family transcriptional regulator [Brevibacillus humidisoli]
MPKYNLKPIVKEETTKERAYKEIKSAILNGYISYDEIFTEVQLAESLNTSRTPIREAVQDLIKEGLVIAIPRKGLTVRKITENELEQIFMLRISIESEVIKKLTGMISQKQLEELKQICQDQEEAMNNDEGAVFINLDQNFHLTLTRFASYELVEQVLLNLHDLSTLIGLQAVKRKNRMNEVLQEHLAIIEAMETQDPEQAARRMIEHLRLTNKSIKLQEKGETS